MARSSAKTQQKYTHDQLTYLGAIFDSTFGFQGTSTNSAIVIRMRSSDYTNWLVKEFGAGESRSELSKKGNEYWGWFLTLEERLQLLQILEDAGKPGEPNPYVRSMEFKDRDLLKIQIEKRIPTSKRTN